MNTYTHRNVGGNRYNSYTHERARRERAPRLSRRKTRIVIQRIRGRRARAEDPMSLRISRDILSISFSVEFRARPRENVIAVMYIFGILHLFIVFSSRRGTENPRTGNQFFFGFLVGSLTRSTRENFRRDFEEREREGKRKTSDQRRACTATALIHYIKYYVYIYIFFYTYILFFS